MSIVRQDSIEEGKRMEEEEKKIDSINCTVDEEKASLDNCHYQVSNWKNKVAYWAKKLSVETGGIERVTDEERDKNGSRVWEACTFWMSANMAVATLNTGMTAGAMGLSFWHTFSVIIVINILTCMLPAWCGTFGLSGLRMTTFSRFSFGYWGNLLVVVFSMISTTGWNAINSLSGAQVWFALSDGACPRWLGVLIICCAVYVLCVLGITWIHHINSYMWIPPLVVWCVAAGCGAKHLDGKAIKSPESVPDSAASALTTMALIFSFAVSWINCAADFNVRMPRNIPRYYIFISTYIGIFIPTVLVQTLGAALYTGTISNPTWKAAYNYAGVGGLLKMALEPAGGFGKFLMVVAGLSSIPNNIPNNYAFALHAQNFGPWAIKIPRIVFVTFGFICAVIVGCFAAQYFSSALQTFLSVIGYWTVIHMTVVGEEHLLFRKSNWSNYNFDTWKDPLLLPFGFGGIGAFCFGFLGAAMGMKVPWYVAPIAKLIGKKGANIGPELSFAFSFITFPFFRLLDKKYNGN